MTNYSSPFYRDLAASTADESERAYFELELLRIRMIDDLINQLDELRANNSIEKAAIARGLQQQPASIRRFFTRKAPNPTISSVIDVAIMLGQRVTLAPLDVSELLPIAAALPTPRTVAAG